LVFWIAGADPHVNDRFGQMCLQDADFLRRDQHVLDVLKKRRWPTVLLYGGGYNRDREHTARLHADSVLRGAGAARSWWKVKRGRRQKNGTGKAKAYENGKS